MTLKLIQEPTAEPLDLDLVKLQLKVSGAEEDALLLNQIQAVRRQVEHKIGRKLGQQIWELVLDAFPAVELDLGVPDVSSVTSITYFDNEGVNQTLAPAAYTLDLESADNGWVLPIADTTWPLTARAVNVVRVRFVCGAQPTAEVTAYMLAQIGTLYRFRESVVGQNVQALPNEFMERLLDSMRSYR